MGLENETLGGIQIEKEALGSIINFATPISAFLNHMEF